MKKVLYAAVCILLIGSASSCSKQCVQCQAKDRYGVVVNTSNVICDYDQNRGKFEDRYQATFQGFTTACANVNN